ncbi:diguanylate cyclase [Oceanispirochaeta sp.]|uniref:diguanylate cyclase domain-containing protein n=1 Tax=Oceanispirochaeta sp. TaxID=2035350 RepID=UPI00260AE241|nr:diguanylate cyclase [Oceanispirochaeta sp.]MDA3956348.1 diguanylate cyclase [Oceanispirochaeta sp.]
MKIKGRFASSSMKRTKLSRFLKYHLTLTAISFMTILGLLLGMRSDTMKDYALSSTIQAGYLGELIESHFQSIKSDILFLARLNEMIHDKEIRNEIDKQNIQNVFLEFASSKKVYDQIRSINNVGDEIVRINYNNGFSFIVKDEDLQNKIDRPYFKETLLLEPDEISVSPVDLYNDNGKIEIPEKLVIHFGTVLFDSMKNPKGVLVLNYLADTLIQILERDTRNHPGTFALLDEYGTWLHNDNKTAEGDFSSSERNISELMKRSPGLWPRIVSNHGMSPFVFGSDLYSVLEIHPLEIASGNSARHTWYLINQISLEEMQTDWKSFLQTLFLYLFLISVVLSIPVWLAVNNIAQRDNYREVLEHSALYDPLTDLPNRLLLSNTASQLLKESNRYNQKFALLYIDLDGFKNVNDTLGHEGGDILLKIVAQKLQECVRESDTVARVGGDEFVILLHRVKGEEDCKIIALKIIDSLGKPFSIPQGEIHIGASVGIAVALPGSSPDLEVLMKRADDAMYKVKSSGKGSFQTG